MNKLIVENFKSIKHLELDCKKVNIFIGKPNTGKSNILEALGLLSHAYYNIYGYKLSDFVRMEDMTNIFYDSEIGVDLRIVFDGDELKLTERGGSFPEFYKGDEIGILEYSGGVSSCKVIDSFSSFKFYKFQPSEVFPEKRFRFLMPPFGKNLVAVLSTNKELRKLVSELFAAFGLKLVLKPVEGSLELWKEVEGVAISYPYHTVSETLQRLVFYMSAIETAENSVIMLEEPESHAFPYYAKYIAELIALDKTNQYFISTHNPIFLLTIIEKVPKVDSMAFLTYFEDFQTKVKPLEHEKILEMESDIFFNLDKILTEAKETDIH